MKRNLNPPIGVNIGARAKAAWRGDARAQVAPRRHQREKRRFFTQRERWAHSFLAISAVVFLTKPSAAVKVRVLAATHLEARVDREPTLTNDVVLQGTLRDDVGAPIPNSHVAITIHGEGGKGAALPLPRATRCSPALAPEAHDPHVAPDEYIVDTDATGSFCIRSEAVLARGVMRLRFEGSAFLERSETEVLFDLSRAPASLAFAPEPSIVALDRPTYMQGLRVTSRRLARGDWHITLRDERNTVVGAGIADDDGYARIEVRTQDLAGPGKGSLTASLDSTPLSAVTHAIERHARVDLEVEDPAPAGDPEEGIPVTVHVRSVRGDVPSGVIELTLGDQPIGAGRVQLGRATILARFGTQRERKTAAQMRYLPDTPWWEPGDPLPVTLHIRPPSPWRRLPLFVLALALAAWMARAPILARLNMPHRRRKRALPLEEPPALQVVRLRKESGDWAGRVFDAHDGYALAGAKISIIVPAFPGAQGEGAGVALSATASENGAFTLAAAPFHGEARLRVESPLHATFEEPLPPPAELAIPLVSRRRRLLDRLVQWATREWGKGALENPTPGQVAARATVGIIPGEEAKWERADRVKSWARAVERSAFDRTVVDEQVEREVVEREPRPHGSYEELTASAPSAAAAKHDEPIR